MSAPPFARARNDEQRAERREAILSAAAVLLDGARVADVSLNELARRVGLAKSNVLRYFQSREAVLLELFDREYREWLDAIDAELDTVVPGDDDAIAEILSRTAASRPVLCELAASATTVLEHNISGEVAAAYKRSAIANAGRLVALVGARGAAVHGDNATAFAGGVNLALGGVWAMCRPSPGMLAAYRDHPELAEYRLDVRVAMRELLATLLTGLRHRPVSPLSGGVDRQGDTL